MALPPMVVATVAFDVPDAPSGLVDNLRARSGLAAESCDAPAWRVQRLFRRSEKDLRPALHAFGYYGAQLEKRLQRGDDCWHAIIDITLGVRTTIASRQIDIRGEAADDPRLAALMDAMPLAEGAELNHADYESIKDRLRQFAAERGYLDFTFSKRELRVNPQSAQADIVLLADSGPRYRFGELRFKQDTLNDGFVHRLAGMRENEPYDARAVATLDRRLSDAGYFQSVEVRPLRDQAKDLAVPIEVKLEPAKRHAWRAGIGFATDTGPRASLQYNNRYVNRRGHSFKSGLSLSPVLSNLTADYTVPGDDPNIESYSFGARLQHEDTDTSTSDSALLAVRHKRRVGRWTQTRFVELLHESSEVGNDETTATLLMPGIGWHRMVAENPLRTRRGYRVNLELRAAHESLLSTATLFRVDAHAKGIYRFGDGGRVTARVDAGSVIGDSIENLPASLRFFAGGDNSVRGYDFKSLGPRDDNDDPRGGRNLLATSFEYEHPVAGEDWWAAAFVDAGNAFDSDSFDPKVGYGVGMRWYSPVGRLRLDIAVPDDTREDQWRLHFGLGADL